MIENSIFEPEDFTFTKNRSHLILKDKPYEKVLDRFLEVLDKLEHKSLPMIRKIEKMLLSSYPGSMIMFGKISKDEKEDSLFNR